MVTRAEQAANRHQYVNIRQRANNAALRDVSDEHPEELEAEKKRLIDAGETIKNYSTKARRHVAMRYPVAVSILRAVYFDHYAKEDGYAPLPGVRNNRDGNNQKFVSPYKEAPDE